MVVPAEMAIGRHTATARRLVNASVSDNTRRAYAGALVQLDAWLDGQKLDDAALAAYLAELHDAGRAASSAALAVAAARFRGRLAGQVDPAVNGHSNFTRCGYVRYGRDGDWLLVPRRQSSDLKQEIDRFRQQCLNAAVFRHTARWRSCIEVRGSKYPPMCFRRARLALIEAAGTGCRRLRTS